MARSGQIETFLGTVTVLATGGAGKHFLHHQPRPATRRVAMAYRAGRIANMEFYQFHPTRLFSPEAKNSHLRGAPGEGGKLRLRSGALVHGAVRSTGRARPREIVARAIDSS